MAMPKKLSETRDIGGTRTAPTSTTVPKGALRAAPAPVKARVDPRNAAATTRNRAFADKSARTALARPLPAPAGLSQRAAAPRTPMQQGSPGASWFGGMEKFPQVVAAPGNMERFPTITPSPVMSRPLPMERVMPDPALTNTYVNNGAPMPLLDRNYGQSVAPAGVDRGVGGLMPQGNPAFAAFAKQEALIRALRGY